MQQNQQQRQFCNGKSLALFGLGLISLALAVDLAAAVITVQIGGATRLNSLNRQRDRYSCYWDCDLVGCQIARDDDECAYDCEKICRVRYDYAAGRSGVSSSGADAAAAASSTNNDELKPKSAAAEQPISGESAAVQQADELVGTGTSVRLHLPRNATARNFAIWERCAQDSSTGKLTEKPFSL